MKCTVVVTQNEQSAWGDHRGHMGAAKCQGSSRKQWEPLRAVSRVAGARQRAGLVHYGSCSWAGLTPGRPPHPCRGSLAGVLASEREEGDGGRDPQGLLPTVPPLSLAWPLPPGPCHAALHPPPCTSFFQFLVYFVYFLVLSVAYLGAALRSLWHFQRGRHQSLPLSQELGSPLEEKAAQALSIQDGDLHSLQPEAPPLIPEDRTQPLGPASREQSQQSEAKA